jgi:hypothetical protein
MGAVYPGRNLESGLLLLFVPRFIATEEEEEEDSLLVVDSFSSDRSDLTME